MQHLMRVSTVCKKFNYFSLGISKSHSLTCLKLKLCFEYIVWEFIQSKMGEIHIIGLDKSISGYPGQVEIYAGQAKNY